MGGGDGISEWIQAHGLPAIVRALNVGVLVATAGFLLFALRRRPAGPATAPRMAWPGALTALALTALLVHQAVWQLAGFAQPEFVRFMQRYDRRPAQAAGRVERGRILDAHGAVLALDQPAERPPRRHPLGAAAAHVVGYADPVYGMAGVEAADDQALSGLTFADAGDFARLGRNLLDRSRARGADVALTLDARLQRAAFEAIGDRPGAAVALRPSDGALLALASRPSFDPDRPGPAFAPGGDDDAPALNRALQGLYPAGSTLKILTAAAALEAGLNPVFDCPGSGFRPARSTPPIRDHEYYSALREGRAWGGHGRIGMNEAFRKSSNVYFAQLGQQVGADRFLAAAHRASLTNALVVLEGSSRRMASAAGRLPPREACPPAEVALLAIGQGRGLVTPLHMAQIAAAVATDGHPWAPRLRAAAQPVRLQPVFGAATAKRLRAMMRETVTGGTGRPADVPGLSVAGKTGTAQTPRGEDHSWFVCLAPVEAPRIVLAVVIEHGGAGSSAAAPAAAAILRAADRAGLVRPDGAAEGRR